MKSMTGFGRGEAANKNYQVVFDVSSVNRKQLDIRFSPPKEAIFLDAMVRNVVPEYISRGNVNVQIKVNYLSGSLNTVKFNDSLVKEYLKHIKQLQNEMGLTKEISIVEVLGLPGAVEATEGEINLDELTAVAKQSLQNALVNLIKSRTLEGEHLNKDLLERKTLIANYVDDLKQLSAHTVELFRQKLLNRLNEAGLQLNLDADRLHQEVVIYADRSDVTEELVRLKAHLEQFELLLKKREPVGRELDFLMQEFNREINTTASKSTDSAMAKIAISVKAELERCREQIQNVE